MTEPGPSTEHVWYSPLAVCRELWKGRTLYRALFHLALERHRARGRILDLGSKTQRQPYYDHLRTDPGSEITTTDLVESEGVVAVNVERAFPFPDRSFDTVLAFQLIEHVFEIDVMPREAYRVLDAGGRAIVSAPFLYEYHPDPEDYFRFTDAALRRLWEDAGFRCTKIEVIGEGPVTAVATTLAHLAAPPSIRSYVAALFYLGATLLDRALDMVRKPIHGKRAAERFALGHLAIFVKS